MNHYILLDRPIQVLPIKSKEEMQKIKSNNLFVRNLDPNIKENELEQFFKSNNLGNIFSTFFQRDEKG